MSDLILPGSPDPKAKGLVDHQRLEFNPDVTSGIETLLYSDEGYIVGRIENELLRFNTDAHLLTISPTGGGKGTGLIIPNLLDHPGSAFVIDIRGETVAKTVTARRLQGQTVVVLDPFDITEGKYGRDSYNPFDRIPKNRDERSADDQILRLVNALMFDPSGRMSNEPIWDNATRNLLSGLVTLCVRYWREYRHNLVEIFDVLSYTPKEMERFIDELTAIIENDPEGQKDRQLKSLLKILTESKSTTKITDNALVQAQTLLTWVGNKSFEGIIEDSTFSFEDMQNGKMTVYLVVPEEYIDNCAIWVRLMLESAVFSLKDVFSTKGVSTSQLPQEDRVLFLLDELPAFGQLDIVSSGMATLRGRGVNLWLFIQNLAQLEDAYGKEKMRTIIGNAASVQVFSSNELEELEYFVRLIGEEFFDVQSISISETETKGTSTAIGQSHTISNSESISKTKGTSQSYSKGTNMNWSHAFGKNQTRGRTDTKGSSTTENRTKGWNKGTSKGEGVTHQRNLLSFSKVSNNENKGKSEGKSGNTSLGSGTNTSTALNTSEGTNETRTRGGGINETNTFGSNESTTEQTQKGFSDTTSQTETTSQSMAVGRSVSVKQERLKIETVRSLREKLSGRNQLLQVRGFHPFFAPRMSYFVRYYNEDRYMFPDMASMTNFEAFVEIKHRLESLKPIAFDFKDFEDRRVIQDLRKYFSNFHEDRYIESNGHSIFLDYRAFLSEEIPSFLAQCSAFEERTQGVQAVFQEAAIANLGLISVMKRLEIDEFSNLDDQLITKMIELQNFSFEKASPVSLLRKYTKLPLIDDIKTDENDKKDNWLAEQLGLPTESEQNTNLLFAMRHRSWLIRIYTPAVKAALENMNADVLNSFVQTYEETKQFLIDVTELVATKLDEAIAKAIDRELEIKQEFFMKRNGI